MWKTIKRKSQRIGFALRQRPVAVSSSATKSFHYLSYLGDDLILEILSFTSCGPLEMSPGKKIVQVGWILLKPIPSHSICKNV